MSMEINVTELGGKLVLVLGEGWTVKSEKDPDSRHQSYWCELSGPPETPCIVLDMRPGATGKGRIEVRGVVPSRTAKGEFISSNTKCEITIGATRTPEAMVADITKRLLPVYAASVKVALAKLAVIDQYDRDCEATRAELGAAAGDLASMSRDGQPNRLDFNLYKSDGPFYGHVKPGADVATLEMHLSKEHAIKVLKLVARLVSGSWKSEMRVGTEWSGNCLRFATKGEAEESAKDIFSRWTLPNEWRVVESPDPANYQRIDGKDLAFPKS